MAAPPPVPALPDTPRITTYTANATVGPFGVGFALYGDSTDYGNWLDVFVDETELVAGAQYTLTSPSGPIATLPRPITDAVITLIGAATGRITIIGARRPRRTNQFTESRGVASRDLNQVLTDIIAQNREAWDFRARTLQLNGGSTFSYLMLPDPDPGKLMQWRADSLGLENVENTTVPPNAYAIATQSEAEAGTSNTALMTPLRTSQEFDALYASTITVSEYACKVDAVAASPRSPYIRIYGINVLGDNGGIDALYSFTATVPPHKHYITCANGRMYVRVPPPAGVPCNVAEMGLVSTISSVDSTPALNDIYDVVLNGGCKNWRFCDLHSDYYFNSLPNPMPAMRLTGPGTKTDFSLYKNFPSASPDQGIFNIHISDTFLDGIRIVGLAGSQDPSTHVGTGCGVSVVSNVTDGAIGYGALGAIEVTSDVTLPNGHACLAYDVYLEGKATAVVGVRAIPMGPLKLFGAEIGSLFQGGGVGFNIQINGTYTAGGLSGKLCLDGGSSGRGADGTLITAGEIFDGADIDFHTGCTINAGLWANGDITISAVCEGIVINGYLGKIDSITNLSPTTKFGDIPYLSGVVTLSTVVVAQNYGAGRSFLITPNVFLQPLDASNTGAVGVLTARSDTGWSACVTGAVALDAQWQAIGIIKTWSP